MACCVWSNGIGRGMGATVTGVYLFVACGPLLGATLLGVVLRSAAPWRDEPPDWGRKACRISGHYFDACRLFLAVAVPTAGQGCVAARLQGPHARANGLPFFSCIWNAPIPG